eukprot:365095-Chlamydomonas_euryale.AAC.3
MGEILCCHGRARVYDCACYLAHAHARDVPAASGRPRHAAGVEPQAHRVQVPDVWQGTQRKHGVVTAAKERRQEHVGKAGHGAGCSIAAGALGAGCVGADDGTHSAVVAGLHEAAVH